MVPVPLSRHSEQYKYRLQHVHHAQVSVKQVTDRKSQAHYKLHYIGPTSDCLSKSVDKKSKQTGWSGRSLECVLNWGTN